MFTRTLAASTAALFVAGAAFAQDGEMEPAAMATLMDQSGTEVGQVEIFETNDGLLFSLEATGIPEGGHGFHVHETGECSGDFTSAGDHYAPGGNSHGLMAEGGPHAGDLPNVYAGMEGNVRADVTSSVLSLEDGDAPVMDDDGSAIIVHEGPDSYGAEAGAGSRIACGVIETAS
ncbi:superoxide dismutase family protein [Roseivivax sediminis]|uniref:Superoxide dismutase, Cu-Zn family n=1 Tax=Roseivivax sediminis TaxID=936889 RepID=A0A1I1UIM3_9RHOB|nr:superoxide dismutase family protein [Roseivivax sediminis]SFD70619.1 superoxide dismutase, Cu-Zn family [Roseivivax sediminis]